MSSALGSDLEQPAVIIGGGVGPLAGILLHRAIIKNTLGAKSDSHHIDVWHISESRFIPDRTDYLLGGGGVNPAVPMSENIAAVGELLAARGRSWIAAVPCATFHSSRIFDEFSLRISRVPGFTSVRNLVQEAVAHLQSLQAPPRTIGVLSTEGAWRTGAWRYPLLEAGMQVVELDEEQIGPLHSAIYDPDYGLKAATPPTRRAEQSVLLAGRQLLERGAEALVLGCTELPFVANSVMTSFGGSVVVCDPVEVLARRIVADVSPFAMRSPC